jgi:hypothetical protein
VGSGAAAVSAAAAALVGGSVEGPAAVLAAVLADRPGEGLVDRLGDVRCQEPGDARVVGVGVVRDEVLGDELGGVRAVVAIVGTIPSPSGTVIGTRAWKKSSEAGTRRVSSPAAMSEKLNAPSDPVV